MPLQAGAKWIRGRVATDSELVRVHSEAHISAAGPHWKPTPVGAGDGAASCDSYVCPATRETALIAAGTAVDTVAAVAGAGAPAGVAIVRPPGHHACADEASGFCYFNNVAVAVKAAQAEFGLRRIMGACQYDSHPPVLPRALK